jgi:NAD(P)-dependent dehydrogenase (short-subunit alcohol dehydrogenase family)
MRRLPGEDARLGRRHGRGWEASSAIDSANYTYHYNEHRISRIWPDWVPDTSKRVEEPMSPLTASTSAAELALALFGLKDQVAVITGAAAGLGRELAIGFAIAGAKVVAADINGKGVMQTADYITERGFNVHAIEADVASESSVISLFERTQEEAGNVSILINNAAIYPFTALEDLSADEWDKVQDIDLRGAFLCTREAIIHMRRNGTRGSIVNISSIAAIHPAIGGLAHYAAAKAGMLGLTRQTAYEVAKDGINVNALVPSGMLTQTRHSATADVLWHGMVADSSRYLLGEAEPWKLVPPVLFLAGPGAAHITGEYLTADGGLSLS